MIRFHQKTQKINMENFIQKISSYHLFNYLFCGIIFAILANSFTGYSFLQKDILIGIFFYYFLGLIVSRLGALMIDPLLKFSGFIKFGDYQNYLTASKKDSTIEVLSELNNVYRTLIAVIPSVLFLKLYEFLEIKFSIIKTVEPYTISIFLLIIFLYAYKKQTSYINKRVLGNLN